MAELVAAWARRAEQVRWWRFLPLGLRIYLLKWRLAGRYLTMLVLVPLLRSVFRYRQARIDRIKSGQNASRDERDG